MLKSFRFTVVLILCLFKHKSFAESEETYVQLPTFVVSGIRTSIDFEEAPYSTYSLEVDNLHRNLFRSLPEALSETPGVLIQKTANGQGSPFLRGFTGYRTLTLIDGVRYNNSVYRDGPNEYFSLIDLYSLSEIQLFQGPNSALYGTDAIGGTLSLSTKSSDYLEKISGETFHHGSQLYRYSTSENSHITRSELQFGKGQEWGFYFGLSLKKFGDIDAAEIGTQSKTGYDEYAWDTRYDQSLNDIWSFSAVHQFLEQDDVWRTHSTVFAKSWEGTEVGTDLRRLKDQRRSLSYVKLTGYAPTDFLEKAILTLSYQTWDENGDRIKSDESRNLEYFDSRMHGADLQLESLNKIGYFIYGFDYYQDRVNSGRTDLLSDGSLDQKRIQGPVGDNAISTLFGAYLQGEFWIDDRLFLTTSCRYSYSEVDIGRFEDPVTGTPATFRDNWDTFVASIRASYKLSKNGNTILWSGVSQSFRAPNLADLSRFGASRSNEIEVAATDLNAEHFLTYEIGVKKNFDALDFSATYYYTQINDFITSTPTGNFNEGLIEVSKQNSAKGFVQGLELDLDYQINQSWSAFVNFTWLEGELTRIEDLQSGTEITEPLSRIMPMTANFGIYWKAAKNRYWASLSGTIADKADQLSSGDRNDIQRIPPGGTPHYSVVHLRGGYQVSEHLELTAGFENIFDEAYRSHGSGSNEPGIGLKVGLQASF